MMWKLPTVAIALGLSMCFSQASAQSTSGGGPVSLILVTWLQAKTDATGAAGTAQSIIGSFSDMNSCLDAGKKAQMINGATALSLNFVCVPNK